MADMVTAPIPGMDTYAGADINATNAYNNALARINQNRLSTMRQFGYTGTVDPTSGVITNMAVDPNNQYGNLQQLLRNSALQAQQDQFAAQDRGLHGGLANQAVSNDKYAFGLGSQQLGTQLTDALSSLQDQQDSAAYTRDAALQDAENQATLAAIAAGNFNTADFSDVTTPPYDDPNNDPTNPPPGPQDIVKLLTTPLANRSSALQSRIAAGPRAQLPAVNPKAAKIIQQQTAKKKKGGK